ncbi:MAG: pilus assembly protein TadG-related protein [Parvularculaceae bacterium]
MRMGRDGNVAITFALAAPALLAAAGLALDFQRLTSQRQALQDAADNLAIHGAKELLLENATKQNVESLMDVWAEKQYFPPLGTFTSTPTVTVSEKTAAIEISQPSKSDFLLSRIFKATTPVVVHATAKAEGVTNVCVIALENSAGGAIEGQANAKLNAPQCAVLSNSVSTQGIKMSGAAKITANLVCSAGGASGGTRNYSTNPVTDCPSYGDPLKERTPPTVGACDFTDTKLGQAPQGALASTVSDIVNGVNGATNGTLLGYTRYDIQPGTYCGGLEVNGKADVHMAPGIYVMKDGKLDVATGARIYGENVGIYLDGDASTFEFDTASIIYLTAPKTGLMAGLLIWESKNAPENRVHKILSANARELLGTFYLPRGELEVKSGMPIADSSAYTAIIAKRFSMAGSPTLVLNTDYSATDVPTPEGVGATGGQVYLRN